MLISMAYKELNRQLHQDREDYGSSGHRWAGQIQSLAREMGYGSVLDYGCGKQTLAEALPELLITPYDPCIEGLDAVPEPHDLVVCTDVLEHIEPECLDAVLDDLKRVTKRFLFAAIHNGPAKKTLPDGRNTHLIQEGANWWLERLMPRFDVRFFQDRKTEHVAMLGAR